jgi:2-dehydropantoate 2-reductase
LSEALSHGLRIRGPAEDIHISNFNCDNSTKEISPCDLVLIAVKATSNPLIVDLIPPLLHEQTMLLTLQNGLATKNF